MMVVTENAEAVMAGMLTEFQQTAPHLRCAWLRFSEFESLPPGYTNAVEASLEGIASPSSVFVFECRDKDVFVVAPHLGHRFLNALFSHPVLTRFSPPAPAPAPGPASLYEIGFDGERLRKAVEQKCALIEKKRQEEKMAEEKRLQAMTEEQERLRRIAMATSVPSSQVETIADRRAARKEVHILVVEDDLFTQKLVHKTLGDDFSVLYVSDAQQAIRKYASFAPDVVFLDIGLPDAPGHDVLRRLMAMDSQAYIVMFSGNGDRSNIMRAVEAGAKGFIGKPFTKGKIAEYIQKSPHVKTKQVKEIV